MGKYLGFIFFAIGCIYAILAVNDILKEENVKQKKQELAPPLVEKEKPEPEKKPGFCVKVVKFSNSYYTIKYSIDNFETEYELHEWLNAVDLRSQYLDTSKENAINFAKKFKTFKDVETYEARLLKKALYREAEFDKKQAEQYEKDFVIKNPSETIVTCTE